MKSRNVEKYENVVVRNDKEVGINNYGLRYMVELEQKLQQKENIIKKAKDFINGKNLKENEYRFAEDFDFAKLLEILDKESQV